MRERRMMMLHKEDRKLLAVEGVGHEVHCPHDMRQSKENTRRLEVHQFFSIQQNNKFFFFFLGWAQKSGALRSFKCNCTEVSLKSFFPLLCIVHPSGCCSELTGCWMKWVFIYCCFIWATFVFYLFTYLFYICTCLFIFSFFFLAT